ncbi:MAG TPA: ABC transporter ATP-binding protein [Candidatus Nanoarchaeia archaeon]|nr:ABC transporter ATP-binding protein [Candidatus Nanoarchaeia archaeon]
MAAIEVNHLFKDFYQYKVFRRGKLLTHALQDVSFKVKKGDFYGLLGRNGAGKSTLLRILTTNLEKTTGKVLINDIDLDKDIRSIKNTISWMFGVDYEGVSWSSVQKNLLLAAYYTGLHKHQAEKRVQELLHYFDLQHHKSLDVWRLSTGLKGRYALAVAMLKQPQVLFLDEPLLGLDVPAKDQVRNYLKQLNKDGVTIIYTDHQLQEMEKVCKNLIIVEHGKKLYDGVLEDLKQKYRETNVVDLVCSGTDINKTLIQLSKDISYVKDYEVLSSQSNLHTVKVYTNIDSQRSLLNIAQYLQRHKMGIESMNAGLLSLEDVYKKFLKKPRPDKQAGHLHSFIRAKEAPTQPYTKYLRASQPEVRGTACSAFLLHQPKHVEEILQKMLTQSQAMRVASLDVIGKAKASHLLKYLLKKKTHDPETTVYLTLALGKIGDISVVDHLLNYLQDETLCAEVLEHVPELAPNVLLLLHHKLRRLSRHELQFITYHIDQSEQKEHISQALHLRKQIKK